MNLPVLESAKNAYNALPSNEMKLGVQASSLAWLNLTRRSWDL
jgi:hypothetical protein